jgi:hypothetical protein
MWVSSWIPIFSARKTRVSVLTSIVRTYEMECCLVTATLELLLQDWLNRHLPH